jgi:hypothetical protein
LKFARRHTDCEVRTADGIRATKRPKRTAIPAVPGDGRRSSSTTPSTKITIKSNLPEHLPPLREEIALWRAFLSEEIEAILRDE